MAKRKLEEKILEELSGDELWDKALDQQDLAISNNNLYSCRQNYKLALKYANAAHAAYLNNALSDYDARQTHLHNAELTQKQLILPFQEKIVEIDQLILAQKEARIQKMQLNTTSSAAAPAIVTPSPTNVPGTAFAQISPAANSHSIYNIFSVRGYSNIHEITCLKGTDLEKYNQLVDRLTTVLRNKQTRDILNSETMQQYAQDLLTFSYDCKNTLLGWIKQEDADPRYIELQERVLMLAKKSAKTAQLYYKELGNRALSLEAIQVVNAANNMLETIGEVPESHDNKLSSNI